MLLLVGLGLAPPQSLTLEAWEALQAADAIYLETYTNIGISVDDFAAFLKKRVAPAPRTTVESEELLTLAKTQTVALCCIGDVFTATTHSVLYLDCLQQDILVKMFQNNGVMTAAALTGLELYKFGQTITIPYPGASYDPRSYLAKIESNRAAGLHTLCLLDIKADEERFMTIPEAIALLEEHLTLALVIGCAKLGTDNHITAGSTEALGQHSWPSQPHCLIIPGQLNAVEQEFVEHWQLH